MTDREPVPLPGPVLPVDVDDLWRNAVGPWDEKAPATLVPLVAEGVGEPLFCLTWASGGVRFFAGAAHAIRGNRPVYGFEMVGYRGNVRPLLSVTDMAERHLSELRLVQPRGPYHLIGMCSGAIVALEIAHRLRSAGAQVATLALVNLPPEPPPVHDPGWGLTDLIEYRLAGFKARFGLHDPVADVPHALDRLRELGWYEQSDEPGDFYRLQVLWASAAFAQEHYTPHRYGGPALIFQHPRSAGSLRDGWRPLLPNAELILIEEATTPGLLADRRFIAAMKRALR